MCGISGALSLSDEKADPGLVHAMAETLRHRGPDEIGVYHNPGISLGHARLSIIDLGGGQQPMSTSEGDLTITFNGEIFNYRELRDELIRKGHQFRTQSDTEVLLHLYREEGEGCVHKLNGQWAFAIWDARTQTLFLSRDRLGVRPLFYTSTPRHFLFASEIKALLVWPEVHFDVDLQALDQILTFWYCLPPFTIAKGIAQLPPGHSMTVRNGAMEVRRYWQLDYQPEPDVDRAGEDRLATRLLDLLEDATKLRLRSDVPVGSYLSGGLDSTLITALAGKFATDGLRTFSVSFTDPEFDESRYQQEAIVALRTNHSDIPCSPQDIARVFPAVVWHAETPLLRTAPAPLFLLSQIVRDHGFKVVLSGEGADEIMGGYDIFKEMKIRRFCGRQPASSWRPLLLKRLYPYMPAMQRQPLDYLRMFFRADAGNSGHLLFSHLPRWTLVSQLKRLLSPASLVAAGMDTAIKAVEEGLPEQFPSWSDFNRAEYLETAHLLPNYILSSQGDRIAMAHSVETRHPFLDYRVVEFAAKLPVTSKMKVLDQKHLLKRAAGPLVPSAIRTRHKQPYRAPEGRVFFHDDMDYVKVALSPESIRRYDIFNPAAVSALVQKFRRKAPTGTRDDMALVAVLSTQILIEQLTNASRRPLPAGTVPTMTASSK